MSTNDEPATTTIGQAVGEDLWLWIVLAAPFFMLWAKHGYGASMRDGDFFLYSVSALLAVCFEWLWEQPADRGRFFSSGEFIFWCYGLVALGGNLYLFVDAPGHHPYWVLNTAFWLAVLFAGFIHILIEVAAWEKAGRPGARETVFWIGRHRYPSKWAARKAVQAVLDGHPVGTELSGEDFDLARDLLDMHPDAAAKIGVGVAGIRIGPMKGLYPRFEVIRTDGGPPTDFSYRDCLKHPISTRRSTT